MAKVYKDNPDYEKKVARLRKEIGRMRNNTERPCGGGLIDRYVEIFEEQKNHILAKTQYLAKKQNKEAVVQRLAKSAEKSRYFDRHFNIMDTESLGGSFWGAVAAGVGIHLAIPAVAVCGAVVAIGCAAYCLKRKHDVEKNRKNYQILKNYAKTGDLDASIEQVEKGVKRLKQSRKNRGKIGPAAYGRKNMGLSK